MLRSVLSQAGSVIASPLVKQATIAVCVILYILIVLFALFNDCSRCAFTDPSLLVQPPKHHRSHLRPCRTNFENLGTVKINVEESIPMKILEFQNLQVQRGGRWRPQHCQPLQSVAIVIPYRQRYEHLQLLLKRLHPMLRNQHLDYRIFVIEQSGNDKFNRGKLMNVGFKEALKIRHFDCFIFHDVDLLPENDKNIYMCDGHARHLSSAIDDMRYHVKYYNYAGGVIAINRTNVEKINGYSNLYWGWGNEDDDLSARTQESGMLLTRPPEHIGKYKMARHKPATRSSHGNAWFLGWRGRWPHDGLNDPRGMNYSVRATRLHPLFTHILTDIGASWNNTIDISKDTTRETLWWFLKFYYP